MEEIIDQLTEKHEKLKVEYVKLMNDKHVLLEWGKPQLEALFNVKLGELMLARLKLQLHIKALRRKIEMVLSAKNKGLDFDLGEIELAVAAELAETELLINDEVEKLVASREYLNNLSSPEKSVGLSKLYKKLAKKLHPDVNPDLTPEQLEIWYKVKAAYENHDYELMQALEIIYEEELNKLSTDINSLPQQELIKRIETLKAGIEKLLNEISVIRSHFPFTFEDRINDNEWVNDEKSRLTEEIELLGVFLKELEEQYLSLINAGQS